VIGLTGNRGGPSSIFPPGYDSELLKGEKRNVYTIPLRDQDHVFQLPPQRLGFL
jgi:hypothetical protein